MLYDRQIRLLAFIDALGGEVESRDFQKLLLLYCDEVEETPPYEFVPSTTGGFSYTSHADKQRLIERQLLADEDRSWKLTPAGRSVAKAPPMVRVRMDRFAGQKADLRGEALVIATYRKRPYYATRSESAERVLAKDPSALSALEAARPPKAEAGICTIGYEGSTLEGYLNRLLRAGVTVLCDVRRNPLSRKFGFSKSTLSKGCAGVGLRYEHLPELGIASDERKDLKVQADYDALFAAYRRESLPRQKQSLEKIRGWVLEGSRVALTCFEAQACQCHRHCVAEALEKQYGTLFKPRHL